jgi:hypothetical protein
VSQKTSVILLPNLLQRSRSTLSRGSFLRFFTFKEGRLGTPISVLGGWATVSLRFFETMACSHNTVVWFDMIRGELAPHNMAPHV